MISSTIGSSKVPATIVKGNTSRPAIALALSQAWRFALLLVLLVVPFAFDPEGLLPFTVPKHAWLLSGATLLLFVWSAAQVARVGASRAPKLSSTPTETPSKITRKAQQLTLLMCVYVAWSVLAPLLTTSNSVLHLANIVRLPALLVVFCLSALLKDDTISNWPRRITKGLAITGSILAIHVLLEAWGIEPLRLLAPVADAGGRWRTFATIGNPAWSAEYLAAVYPLVQLSLWQLLKQDNDRKLNATEPGLEIYKWLSFVPLLVWGVFCAGIAVTGSRLGLLAFAVASIVMAHNWQPARNLEGESSRLTHLPRLSTIPIIPVTIASVCALLLSLPYMTSWPQRLLDSGSIAGRYVLLRTGLAMVASSPLFGHGAGSLALIAPEYLRRILPTLPENWLLNLSHDLADHVHNEFVQTAVDGGVPSAILLALVWLIAIQLVFRSMSTFSKGHYQFVRAIGASLVAILVCSFGSAPLYTTPTAVLFWALLGLLVGATNTHIFHLRRSIRSRWRTLIAVVACGVCVITVSWQVNLMSANRLASRAEAYVAHGLYTDAEADYHRVVALWPWNYETRIKAAAVHAQTGKLAAALAEVEESAHWGASPEGWLLASELLMALDKDSEAQAVLQQALDVIPDLMRARLALANLQRQAGQRKAALQQYRLIIASPQQSPLAMQIKKRAVDSLVAIAQETMPASE